MLAAVLALGSPLLAAEEEDHIQHDFNFDGHMDYSVLSFANAKGSTYDVFLYDPATKKHHKDKTLSGKIYPHPDPKTKLVKCVFNGGHAGAVYTSEAYRWNGKSFELAYLESQDYLRFSEKEARYVRSTAHVADGQVQPPKIQVVSPSK